MMIVDCVLCFVAIGIICLEESGANSYVLLIRRGSDVWVVDIFWIAQVVRHLFDFCKRMMGDQRVLMPLCVSLTKAHAGVQLLSLQYLMQMQAVNPCDVCCPTHLEYMLARPICTPRCGYPMHCSCIEDHTRDF
jgi:hypothetical protein